MAAVIRASAASFHLAELQLHAHIGAFQVQAVAGNHLTAELHAVQAGEKKEFVREVAHARRGQQTAGLGQGLQDQYARHDRHAGKMALEKGFVDADVFISLDMRARHAFHHPVHQEKRVTVGQNAQNALNIHSLALSDRILHMFSPARPAPVER